jgi:tetratricopeptide (TPR) repeat protein
MELAIGDPAAAERYLREGYEAFRAMGERGYFTSVATLLAKALYEQSRLDEAQQMIEEAKAAAGPDDLDTDVYWQTTRAKLLAWRGRLPRCPAGDGRGSGAYLVGLLSVGAG